MTIGSSGRIVVKVGSSGVVGGSKTRSRRRMENLVTGLADAWAAGRECVLVSSGAIASGLSPLGLHQRPKRLPALQAAAAVGQSRLMAEYTRAFARRGLLAAQILLTREDFMKRRHFVNAQRTLEHLLAARVIPIVNENDTVATEEITFGDNDQLAALVAIMVKAELLVLLSDVEGVFTRRPGEPGARLMPIMSAELDVDTGGGRSAVGMGGMASKIEAAGLATAAGIPTVVASAFQRDVLGKILAGERPGTWFPARGKHKQARKAWMAFATDPRGRIVVDLGAQRAVRDAGKSVLAAGVIGVEGRFDAGDPIDVVGPDGVPFARGISRYSDRELSSDLAPLSEHCGDSRERHKGEVIHRDELVLTMVGSWSG